VMIMVINEFQLFVLKTRRKCFSKKKSILPNQRIPVLKKPNVVELAPPGLWQTMLLLSQFHLIAF
jgi:hypothetical protein